MCQEIKVLNQSKNGFIIWCGYCEKYHLTFVQLYIDFHEVELRSFVDFLHKIDQDCWDGYYQHSFLKRKIPVPTQQNNLHIMLSKSELNELIHLLSFDTVKAKQVDFLKVRDIDYDFIEN